ncbi:hypothetical protein ACO0RG_002027 [Hanseniaspora osmophila]
MSTAEFYANPNKITDENTVYSSSLPNFDIREFKITEDWNGRPASEWSWKAINVLLSKIELYEKQLYHSRTIGRKSIKEFIPLNKLIDFCNESFGYNGWNTEVTHVISNKVEKPASQEELLKRQNKTEETAEAEVNDQELDGTSMKYQVVTETKVKFILKDGTNVHALGFAQHTSFSLVRSMERSKKESVNKSLKNAILSFDTVATEYENKLDSNFYQDGLYGSKNYVAKKETIGE